MGIWKVVTGWTSKLLPCLAVGGAGHGYSHHQGSAQERTHIYEESEGYGSIPRANSPTRSIETIDSDDSRTMETPDYVKGIGEGRRRWERIIRRSTRGRGRRIVLSELPYDTSIEVEIMRQIEMEDFPLWNRKAVTDLKHDLYARALRDGYVAYVLTEEGVEEETVHPEVVRPHVVQRIINRGLSYNNREIRVMLSDERKKLIAGYDVLWQSYYTRHCNMIRPGFFQRLGIWGGKKLLQMGGTSTLPPQQ